MDSDRKKLWVRSNLWIITIAAAATVISLLASHYNRPQVLKFDEQYYFHVAQSIASGRYEDGYIVRPPLYPLFVGLIFRFFALRLSIILCIQSILRGLLVAQVAWLGRKYFSTWTGICASIIVTIYPLMIWIYTRVLNEAVYLPIFLLSIWAIERAYRKKTMHDGFWAGVICGLASLVRVTSFFLTLILAFWIASARSNGRQFAGRSLQAALMAVVGLFLTISPWMVRNAVVHKTFMPLGNEAAFNLFFTVAGLSVDQAREEWNSWGAQGERQRIALERWWQYVKEHPAHHLKRLLKNLPRVFKLGSQGFATGLAVIYSGMGCHRNMRINAILQVVIPITFFLVMVGGLIGLVFLRESQHVRTLWLIVSIYFILLHPATVMKARYFLPVVPLLSISSAKLIEVLIKPFGRLRR